MSPETMKISWYFLCVIGFVCLFWRQIGRFIDRMNKVKIRLSSGQEIVLTAAESKDAAGTLLDEVDRLIRRLTDDDKALLAKIIDQGGAVLIEQVLPGFRRDTPEHESLRRLRDCQLIRPVGSGRFEAGKYLEIKPFGRALLRIRFQDLLQ